MLLILVGLIDLILIKSCSISIQGRKPYLSDFNNNNKTTKNKFRFNVGLHSNVNEPDFFQIWYHDKDH